VKTPTEAGVVVVATSLLSTGRAATCTTKPSELTSLSCSLRVSTQSLPKKSPYRVVFCLYCLTTKTKAMISPMLIRQMLCQPILTSSIIHASLCSGLETRDTPPEVIWHTVRRRKLCLFSKPKTLRQFGENDERHASQIDSRSTPRRHGLSSHQSTIPWNHLLCWMGQRLAEKRHTDRRIIKADNNVSASTRKPQSTDGAFKFAKFQIALTPPTPSQIMHAPHQQFLC
jgi:hypothetical protein